MCFGGNIILKMEFFFTSSEQNPINGSIVSDHVVQFVDDTSQFLNHLGVPHAQNTPAQSESAQSESDPDLPSLASKNSKILNNLLRIPGGKLNLQKCFYYAFKARINYKNNSITYSKLDPEHTFTVTDHWTGTRHPIQSLHPSDSQRTLGVILSPDGNGSAQLKHSYGKAKEFYAKYKNTLLSQKAQLIAVYTIIGLYPLVTTCFLL